MPSKSSQHIAFFVVLCVSAGLHWYVYANLKRVLLRDYPKLGRKLASIALLLFITMDTPFVFLYFRGTIHGDFTTLTRALLYPFSIWQILMLMWAIVLVPFSLWRRERLGIAWTRERIRRFRNERFRNRSVEMGEDREEMTLEVAAE